LQIEYAEVAQSEQGQLERLRMVLDVTNQILARPRQWDGNAKWSPEMIKQKQLVAILNLLIALALHFRAPIRFPEYANAQLLIVQKRDGQLRTRWV
jgi:parvin